MWVVRKRTQSRLFVDGLLPSVLRLNSDFAFAASVPCSCLRTVHVHTHTHTHTHSWKMFETISKWLGGGGCSHNNVSLLAFFCGSKSGSMFVDAEGGMEECVCVCGCVCARALVMNGTHHRPALVIPSHAVCIYLNKLNFWFTGTFMDIVPCTCFSSTLLTASPHFSLSLSSLL